MQRAVVKTVLFSPHECMDMGKIPNAVLEFKSPECVDHGAENFFDACDAVHTQDGNLHLDSNQCESSFLLW